MDNIWTLEGHSNNMHILPKFKKRNNNIKMQDF